MRPGWQTTEFYITLIAQVLPILVLFHVVPQADADTLKGQLDAIVQGVAAVVVPSIAIWKYIQGRVELKKASMGGTP